MKALLQVARNCRRIVAWIERTRRRSNVGYANPF